MTLPLIAIIYASIVTYALSHVVLKRYLENDLVAMVAAQARADQDPSMNDKFWRLFLLEYALPWSLVIFFVNFILALKGKGKHRSRFALRHGRARAVTSVKRDNDKLRHLGVDGTHCHEPGRARLLLEHEKKAKTPAESRRVVVVVLVLLFGVPLGLGLSMHGFFAISGIQFFSVLDVVAITLLIVAGAGIAGLRIGMVFGLALENLKPRMKA